MVDGGPAAQVARCQTATNSAKMASDTSAARKVSERVMRSAPALAPWGAVVGLLRWLDQWTPGACIIPGLTWSA